MTNTLTFSEIISIHQFSTILQSEAGFDQFELVFIHRLADELEDLVLAKMRQTGLVLTDKQIETLQRAREDAGLYNYS